MRWTTNSDYSENEMKLFTFFGTAGMIMYSAMGYWGVYVACIEKALWTR